MARLRHLVVVVPGIGGSVLAGPPDGSPAGGGYALTPGGLARVLRDPDRLDLRRFPELAPTGLVEDLALLPPLLTLPGYQRLCGLLRTGFDDVRIDTYCPPEPIHPRTDVLMFPYDFRRSVADASARLAEAVGEALAGTPGRRVIVLGHSLGGLVGRHWVAVREGWRHCTALVTLGTPHRGAPKALDWLVNGAGAGALRDPRMTRVIRGWPSVYELLPQYEAVWDEAERKPFELTRLPGQLLARRPKLAGYAPQFADQAKAARLVHDEIRDGFAALPPDQAPAVVPYFARGHATANLVTLGQGRLRVSKQDPQWRGNVGWRGDGTVPAISAIPPELEDERHRHGWQPVPDRHGPIGHTPGLVELLRSYAGGPLPARGGELPDRPWLGLDLDEFALAGEPVPLGVTLQPAPPPLTGTRACVLVTPLAGTVAVHSGCLAQAGVDETGAPLWQGELPPLPPGEYDVAVEVGGVPVLESVAHAATLAVLDPAAAGSSDIDGEEPV